MSKGLQIRNSTVDFLVFTRDAGEDGIEVRVQNGDVWLTQKAISQLFDVDRSVITKHLSNIFKEGELDENSVCAKFAQTADDGKTYNYKFYSLAAIIAVGYRINSERAMQFRTWATKVLDTFTKQGYVLDKSRLINGQIFDEDYFEHLIAEIQEIRASERRFYQKITDIYATAVDYDKNSQVTREFYATVQNKMHYAVHGNTAAEVIVARADHNKEHMGLKSWKKLKEHIGNRCELIEHVQPKRLYTEIGAGIEVKNVPGSKVSMLVDEEFYFHCDETKLNKIASWLYETDRHGYPILGNVLIIGEKYGNAGIEFCEMSEEQFDLVFPKLKELGKRFKDAGD